jgi:Kef-type K+ transport system membrane component KefB
VDHALINDIAICIVVAWVLALVAQLLRQPLILAYMVAGYVIGPVGVGLVKEKTSIETISGLGLILLLFMIGLEIDLKKMLSAGKLILLTAIVQMVGTCVLGLGLFSITGFPLRTGSLDALYLALATALSSTVIIIKILYERREIDTFAGRITIGVLVLQDLFAILFLAIQPDLKNPSVLLLLRSLGKVSVLVAVAFAASRFVLPPLFRAVARLPELVLVGALAWCFLLAGMAGTLGLSREMGALIAGVAISTFPYTLDVTAKVTSLRDFFVTLFFVALGLKIPAPTWFLVSQAILIGLFVLISRLLTVFALLYSTRQGIRASLAPAINLSQISELSLIIVTLGIDFGHVSKSTFFLVAYAFAFLAIASSYALARGDTLLIRCVQLLKNLGLRDLDEDEEGLSPEPKRSPRIFILGFSWTASSLLEEIVRRQPDILPELAVVDFNPVVHKTLRGRGLQAIYGDISQRDTLLHAGVDRAEIILCTLPNTVLKGTSNLRLLRQLREINPTAQIIVHAELFGDVAKLYAAGADYVSLPRLIEAVDLCDVIDAARKHLLDQKRNDVKREFENRNEVIP